MAAPLSRTNEIVILSGEGSRVTGEVNRLLAELPVSVHALTGVDLTKVSVAYINQTPPVNLHGYFLCGISWIRYVSLVFAETFGCLISLNQNGIQTILLVICIFVRDEIFSGGKTLLLHPGQPPTKSTC